MEETLTVDSGNPPNRRVVGFLSCWGLLGIQLWDFQGRRQLAECFSGAAYLLRDPLVFNTPTSQSI